MFNRLDDTVGTVVMAVFFLALSALALAGAYRLSGVGDAKPAPHACPACPCCPCGPDCPCVPEGDE